jgi:CRISPR-associated endonuclease/helicase Cas3
MWAHSGNVLGRRHGRLVEHLRSTGAIAGGFAAPLGAAQLAEALGLLHNAGKADCGWRDRLGAAEGTDRPVGRDHKTLGVKLLLEAAGPVALDYLDTGAHFGGRGRSLIAPGAEMGALLRRFGERGAVLLAAAESEVNRLPAEVYCRAVGAAQGPTGLYRLPAPTGSGKTITAAGFALHDATRHGKSRVIVAVPFVTITERNPQVYRELLDTGGGDW